MCKKIVGYLAAAALLGLGQAGYAPSAEGGIGKLPPSCIALVIGNAAYLGIFPKLANPVNDARLVGTTLSTIGFSVDLGLDLTRDNTMRMLADFADKARGANVALIYLSGHGAEVNGQDWFAPVDARAETLADASSQLVSISNLLAAVGNAQEAGILLPDISRDKPSLGRAGSPRGLPASALRAATVLPVSEPAGLNGLVHAPSAWVFYAASPGSDARDEVDGSQNSPFAAALAKYLTTPGLEFTQLAKRVTADVIKVTANGQRPWLSGVGAGDVYLSGTASRCSSVR